MKLVIDIPDGLKQQIDIASDDWACMQVEAYQQIIAIAIKNGTFLPNGHGDLIDRDALIQKQFIPNLGFELVDLDDLKTAPTVIPADK